jgi:hypothetical protein
MLQKTLVLSIPYLEPHRPPITGGILCQIAKDSGHIVNAIDLNIILYRYNEKMWWELKKKTYAGNHNIDDIVPEDLYKNLLENNLEVDWILLTQLTQFDFASLYHICKWLRPRTQAKIIVGGPGLEAAMGDKTSFGKFLHENKLVDYYVYGEGEIALRELFKGNIDFPGINGTTPKQIDDLESLPLPNYEFYNLDLYQYPIGEKDFYIYGSRGCVKTCTFCDIRHYWPKYRYRSGTSIAKEMIGYYEQYGTKNFYFADSLLNGSLKEFRYFCETLSNYQPAKNFKWSGFFLIRPKKSHNKELFEMIKSSGGYFLNCGIETGVDRIREEMAKGFTNDDVDWHLENCSYYGLTNQFQLITTWPTETLAEHYEYLKIFQRWEPYVADGTISSVSLNGHPSWLDGSSLGTLDDFYVENRNNNNTVANKVLFYLSKKNPEFTIAERYQRSINVINEARKYRWPMDRIETKIIEWMEQLKVYTT